MTGVLQSSSPAALSAVAEDASNDVVLRAIRDNWSVTTKWHPQLPSSTAKFNEPRYEGRSMKKASGILAACAIIGFLGVAHASASEMTCGSTGGMNRCPLPGADKLHVKVKQVLEGDCAHETGWWADSDGIVVDKGCNAVFKYQASAASSSSGTDANASAYYDDGCKAGKKDKKAGLSMAYERHAGSYDSQNAGSYQAGYEKCWMKAK
jgi:hypothetical protein